MNELVNNAVYLILCAVILATLVVKLRQIRGRWKNPRYIAVSAVVLLILVCTWIVAPTNYVRLSSVTGIPNIAVPLLLSLLIMCGALYLGVALLWRYPARTAWRRLRWILAAYAFVTAVMCALFAMSTVPDDRPVDFIFHYLDQPTITGMALLWLLAQLAGAAVLTVWCFSWARSGDYDALPWLRRGLRLYGAFGLCMAAFSLGVIIPITAHWFGVSTLNALGNAVPLVAVPGAVACLVGALVVPVWGPRLSALGVWLGRWRLFAVLRRLHRALVHVNPDVVFVADGKRFDPHHRVRRMLIELNDWRWTLAELFDPAERGRAEELAARSGVGDVRAGALVEAAQLAAASAAWRRGERVGGGAGRNEEAAVRDGGDLDAELDWWVHVARAYREVAVGASGGIPGLRGPGQTKRPDETTTR